MRQFAVVSCLLLSPIAVHAQPSITLSFKPGNIDRLVKVMAHDARCVALSENQGWLAFGHDKGFPEAQVSLCKLDAQGMPPVKAIPIKFPPLPPVLAKDKLYEKETSFPLAMAFHPKLPLLYCWQDFTINPNIATVPAGLMEYDHLLIYDVSKSPPQLVISLCRGKDFLFGQSGAALGVDPDGGFLILPNFRDDKNPVYWHMGRFPLDADGMPKFLDKDVPLPERIKQLTAANLAKSFVPPQRTLPDNVNYFPCYNLGTTTSVHILNRDTILFGGVKYLITWRPDDKLVTQSCLPLKHALPTYFAVHPKLPGVYASKLNTNSMFHAQQIDGNWTLLPTEWNFPERLVSSAPAVLTKSNKVAVAGHHRVYLVDLDAEGHGRPEAIEMPIFNPQCRALVYSEKHDRLYCSVDLSR